MKKYISYVFIGIFLPLVEFGCSEDYLIEEPPHIITAESLYKNLEGFETGLNGLYALVWEERQGRSDGGANALRAAMWMDGTDVLTPNRSDGFGSVAIGWQERNNPSADDVTAQFLWLYQIINSANTVIGRAENPGIEWVGNGKTAEENKHRVIAEARVIRAWAYRHLAYLYGDVPLTLEESLGSNVRTDWQ
ncbi:MAG: hypothetical protein HC819_15945 [Cyclobacteriaceae bacterium]|nr:hypothetical protein [Cyclobacteriaceae bacterium]